VLLYGMQFAPKLPPEHPTQAVADGASA